MKDKEVERALKGVWSPLGAAERFFASQEGKTAKDVPGLLKSRYCTAFPNSSKNSIVEGENSKAYLIVPKSEYFEKYGLTSFFKFDLSREDQRKVLKDMVDTALEAVNPKDLIMFFNVLKEKVPVEDREHCAIMSIAYLHLWAVEKSKMYNDDTVFHRNAEIDKFPIFSVKEVAELKRLVFGIIGKTEGASFVEKTSPKSFAPIHIRVEGKGRKDADAIIDSLVKANRILREIDSHTSTKKLAERGFRLMVRKNDAWSSNILGGGRLSAISNLAIRRK